MVVTGTGGFVTPFPTGLGPVEVEMTTGETVVVAASGSVFVSVLTREATAKVVSVRTKDKSEFMVMLVGGGV